jgi:hypothetical protein
LEHSPDGSQRIKPVRMAKIEMLEGQLNRFVIFDDETPQDMFNQLKKIVNKAKALGFKKWIDHMWTEHLIMTYTLMNYNVIALIHQDSTYKRMTSDDVLGRIINCEMYIKEANHIKNLYKSVSTTNKQEIALKASMKSKNKQVVVESSSEEEEKEEEDRSECDAEKMTLFMRKFKKYINKKKFSKGDKKFNTKSTTKRICYNCGKHDYFIANYPFEHRDDDDDKKKSKFYKKDKGYKRMISHRRRSHMVKLTLVKNMISMMKAPTPIIMVWQLLLSREQLLQASLSSQSSIKKNALT